MNKRKPTDARQLMRERLLFRYSSALERGDFETLETVLLEAQHDPTLGDLILDLNRAYEAELSAAHTILSARESEKEIFMNTLVIHPARTRSLWTLAAALVALAFFGALLLALRPGRQQPEIISLGAQGTTPTAIHITELSATPISTFFPTMIEAVPSGSLELTATAVPFSLIATANASCQVVILVPGGVDVYSRPDPTAVVTGRIPSSIPVIVLDQVFAPLQPNDPYNQITWLYISVVVDGVTVQGWADSRLTGPLGSGCLPPTEVALIASDSPTSTMILVPFTATPNVTETATQIGVSTVTAMATPLSPLCHVANMGSDPLDLYIGIPSGTGYAFAPQYLSVAGLGEVLLQRRSADGFIWFFVVTHLPESASGWVQSDMVASFDVCPPLEEVANASTIAPPDPTPIMSPFDLSPAFITTEKIGDIPAYTPIRSQGGYLDGKENIYHVVAEGTDTIFLARESQLAYIGSGAWHPGFAIEPHDSLFTVTTLWPIGDVPRGTRVQIRSAWFGPFGWVYHIQTEAGVQAQGSDFQLYQQFEGGMCFALSRHDEMLIYPLPSTEMGLDRVSRLQNKDGTAGDITGQLRGDDGYIWYFINDDFTGLGWVREDVIWISGQCPQLSTLYTQSTAIAPNPTP